MCTGFVRKGNDLICGYNLDLKDNSYDFQVYPKDDLFYIGIKIGNKIYKTHGLNKNGNFGNLPYMNDLSKGKYHIGKNCKRIDLLINDYIEGKYSFDDVLTLVDTMNIINVPHASMHALLSDINGRMLLIEPGLGYQIINKKYSIITNFPLLETLDDLSQIWYGKERYDIGLQILENSTDDFNVYDGLKLLEATKQVNDWPTRISFVYSRNENAIYYVLNNNFEKIIIHHFK